MVCESNEEKSQKVNRVNWAVFPRFGASAEPVTIPKSLRSHQSQLPPAWGLQSSEI